MVSDKLRSPPILAERRRNSLSADALAVLERNRLGILVDG
jgi:hypothetical protein